MANYNTVEIKEIDEMVMLRKDGYTIKAIAEFMGRSYACVKYWLDDSGEFKKNMRGTANGKKNKPAKTEEAKVDAIAVVEHKPATNLKILTDLTSIQARNGVTFVLDKLLNKLIIQKGDVIMELDSKEALELMFDMEEVLCNNVAK